jgi:hypothetical protein
VAQDAFARTVSGGWGSAPTGGAWTVVAGGTAPFSVDGARGLVATPTGSQQRVVSLDSTSLRDVDVRVNVTFPDSAGTSGSYYAYVVLRRQTADNSYLRVGLIAQGKSLLIRSQDSAGTTLWPNVSTGLTFTPGTTYVLRVQAEGAAPTTLRARAWALGTAEPSTWPVSGTTSNGPQVAGAVGLRTNNDTVTATTIAFDDFSAAAL